MNKLSAYELIEKRNIKELRSEAYLLRHKKTGARVVLMENEDENKVFYIGFRTTPKESTGVSHILEHSVLCGSKNFPVKDPFMELIKGSLNTFMNAFTYPDKTVYPVASCNDKDFQNLMHVYLDAVFYPNIYAHDLTFRQEGWRYELENKDSELTLNGVVYNEMKGVVSSPDDVLELEIAHSLFPDNAYSENSGGDPDHIPELTYEHYLEMHRTYYHPSNSYIYLYGDMDMAEKLTFIDEQYLSHFDALEMDTDIAIQEAFDAPREVVKQFSVSDEEELTDNTYLSYNVAMKDNLDAEKYLAYQVLDYALCSAPGTPLKQALLDAGIGKDVYCFYENGVKQPNFSIIAKNTEKSKKEQFISLIDTTLQTLCENGLDKKALTAGLNYYEFRYREADFGSYPPGLMYGLQILDSWLYDEKQPFLHVEANDTFKSLREKIGTDYYENLIREGFLENTHKTYVIVEPEVGLTEKKEQELREKLQQYKASLSEDELEKIVEDTRRLKEFQEEEDSPEALACIPMLSKEDIKKETAPLYNEEKKIGENTALFHDIYTNGISYFRFMFQADKVPTEYLPYLGLLKNVLSYVDTKQHSYGELFNEIYIQTGGMTPVVNIYTDAHDLSRCRVFFEWKVKTFENKISEAVKLAKEVLLESVFTDKKRLYEIIAELKSRMQSDMVESGHTVSMNRASSYFSKTAAISDRINGLTMYRVISELEKEYEKCKGEAVRILEDLCDYLFRPENLMYDFTGSKDAYERFANEVSDFASRLSVRELTKAGYNVIPEKKNEGLMTAGQVQYVSKTGNFIQKGLPYTGVLRMLKMILAFGYLYPEVRVKGGAYGCSSGFGKSGDSFFSSYRDPNLAKTLEVYDKAAEFIRQFSGDERTMTQYLIGTISTLDTPMTPQTKGLRSLSAYMTNQTLEDFQQERDELIGATEEDVRKMADYIEAVLEEDCICVVGAASKIKENEDFFKIVENLL